MTWVITSATAHLRPVRVERSPGLPVVVRYSIEMQAELVFRQALPDLSDDEAAILAEMLGLTLDTKEVG